MTYLFTVTAYPHISYAKRGGQLIRMLPNKFQSAQCQLSCQDGPLPHPTLLAAVRGMRPQIASTRLIGAAADSRSPPERAPSSSRVTPPFSAGLAPIRTPPTYGHGEKVGTSPRHRALRRQPIFRNVYGQEAPLVSDLLWALCGGYRPEDSVLSQENYFAHFAGSVFPDGRRGGDSPVLLCLVACSAGFGLCFPALTEF